MRKIKRHLILLKHYKQQTNYSCGVVCIRMLLERFGLNYSEKTLREIANCDNIGLDEEEIRQTLRELGFKCIVHTNMSFGRLIKKLNENIPLLVGFKDHWQVIVGYDIEYIYITDPASNRFMRRMNKKKFKSFWKTDNNETLELLNR